MKTCKYGTNRVIEPKNVLPQAAKKIDPSLPIYDNELLIDVAVLNIDSASFTQIKKACDGDEKKMKDMILSIVKERGKMQNPVTGSGGMLIGTILEKGENHPDSTINVGDKVATLVSLSLTPLILEEIVKIHLDKDQVEVKAKAILFESGIYAVLPKDINETLALAALDVAGAPAQTNKLVGKDDHVVIIGAAGKSGILCAYQAKQNAKNGRVVGVVNEESQVELLRSLNLCDDIVLADATNAIDVYTKVKEVLPNLADVVINVVNVENTEMASVLSAKNTGTVYFFSMATSFTKAALGAEGVGSDVTMLIGNGYTKDHADFTLNILRNDPVIRKLYEERYI
jgi:L-erythro-3,5-diaminohexanoate dehydrogenase